MKGDKAMKISSKPIKEKVKAKAKALKEKLKGSAKKCAALVAVFALAILAGCQTPEQASRSTANTNGDIEPTVKVAIGENAASNTVTVAIHVKLGDGAIASADSAGSTESQTQTPTFDIKPDLDVRYNDAIAGATSASKGVLETLLSASASKVVEMMASGGTGTVEVTKKDGTSATVKCENGQCEVCEDCAP